MPEAADLATDPGAGWDTPTSPDPGSRSGAGADADLATDLHQLRERRLYRRRRTLQGPQGAHVRLDGRDLLSFCSNDYLGLAGHPELARALQDASRRYGVGSGSAHLVIGHSEAHQRLEQALADFVGRPRALLFSTGYMANLGVLQALAGRGQRILADRLNHASLTDGARLSGARLLRYAHGDPQDLQRLLDDGDPRLIVTDGVFSMDGDLAPLRQLAALARARGARLMLDDAHGLGVLGAQGRGTLEHLGLDGIDSGTDGGIDAVPILIGTLGKAFGTFGAFVAGSDALIETLIQRARPYIYTTALPPALAEATCVALDIARREHWRRQRLRALTARFRAGAAELGLELGLADAHTPIQPLIAGDAGRALAWSRHLEQHGVLVTAIRPPTVPQGTARLRITFSAAHTEADVDRLLSLLAQLPSGPGGKTGDI
ncbi:8-amino-7-oxononanoate synthase [Thiohalocapsa marina]|uniref:8-amino-7-oxononanoate synthase n=1 Tax=Thiohalocapsa marina TaxID=424902 RepID=A0A5M8FVB9_9GAMM|nr:8-amino-7-oxononanoate synthase [Thiohalocapsa marina]KAA6187781.1 8-amino-7-oxononanoate synthase [Thiohalocapsa marina]